MLLVLVGAILSGCGPHGLTTPSPAQPSPSAALTPRPPDRVVTPPPVRMSSDLPIR